jgi:hypothetical protein
MHILPRRVAGSQQSLSDNLVVSILIDRSLTLTCGKAVLVLLTAEEAIELRRYLASHAKLYPIDGGKGGE